MSKKFANQKNSQYKVTHDVKDINEGVDYEFVLKDRNVLDVDEENDLEELENAILKDYSKSKDRKSKGREDIIPAFDETHRRTILSQYDEKKEESFLLRREDINESQEYAGRNKEEVENQEKEISKIKEKLRQMKEGKNGKNPSVPTVNNLISHNIYINSQANTALFTATTCGNIKPKPTMELKTQKVFSSDYMTQEEFKGREFKKLKSVPLKKRIQSIETIDKDEIPVNNIPDKNLPSQVKKVNNQVYDEYDELNLFLEKQRNLINRDKKSRPTEEKIKKIIQESTVNKKEEETETKAKQVEESSKDGKTYTKEESEEFISETTQFLSKVPTKKEIEENLNMITSQTPISLKDVKSGTHSVVNIPLPNERLKYGVSSVLRNNNLSSEEEYKLTLANKFLNKKRKPTSEEKMSVGTATNIDESELEEGHENPLEDLEEPLVGKGIGTALKVLKSRGLVGKKEMWGRFKDKVYTTNDMFLEKGKDKTKQPSRFKKEFDHEINIEYRDNRGRLLTPKEMYRYQSYIFHGKGPGRKKIEKRLLREQIAEKNKNKDPSQTKSFLYLKNMQMKKNTPFITLQGKNPTLP